MHAYNEIFVIINCKKIVNNSEKYFITITPTEYIFRGIFYISIIKYIDKFIKLMF